MGRSRESSVFLYRCKGGDRAIVIAFFVAFGAGCASTQTPQLNPADANASWLANGETIAILSSPEFLFHWEHDLRDTRIDPLGCARKGLSAEGIDDRVISEETFKRTAFPDLPPQAAPTDPQSIRLLLTHPTLLDRIEPLNLRYIVYATSETEVRDAVEFWSGFADAYGGAFVGQKNWNQSSEYSFLVIDAKAIKDVASAQSREDGTGWWIAGMAVLPFALGYESPTEQEACDQMALELRDALRANTTK